MCLGRAFLGSANSIQCMWHGLSLKSERSNPWFYILLHTLSIVYATVQGQRLLYLRYITLVDSWSRQICAKDHWLLHWASNQCPPSDLWTVSVNVCSKSYAMYLYVEGQFFPCFLLRDFWDLPEKEPANFNQVLGCLFDTYTSFQNE